MRTSDQSLFGGWIFSSCEDEIKFDLIHHDFSREMHLAAVLAFERMVTLGLGNRFKYNLLSDRERECLIWLCMGLRSSAIADKLVISESAVNLYISNAKNKLGAKTREQAIARAIFSGEIAL